MVTKDLSRIEKWVETNPYLEEFALLDSSIKNILESSGYTAEIPDWEKYSEDYLNGIPFLESGFLPDGILSSASCKLTDLVKLMNNSAFPAGFTESIRELDERMKLDPELGFKILSGVIKSGLDNSDDSYTLSSIEFFLGWRVLAAVIRPLSESFMLWRDESKWKRGYCPTCGSSPATALIGKGNNGSVRHLACGICQTKWMYRRLGCPYCGNESPEKLEIFELEEEPGIRIDVCNECKGYIKTCTDENYGDIVILDWTTLHLDSIAKEKGYKRIGAGLYEL